MKRETEEQAIERRKKTYGCDGKCYSESHCCGAIDICDETRVGEAIGCCLAFFLLFIYCVVVPVLGLAWVAWWLFRVVTGG